MGGRDDFGSLGDRFRLGFVGCACLAALACGDPGAADDDAADAGFDEFDGGDAPDVPGDATDVPDDDAADADDGGSACEFVECEGVCCEAGRVCEGGTCSTEAAAFPGYTLYLPNMSRTATLIDMEGRTVHTWTSAAGGGYSAYLLENGHLLRSVGSTRTTLGGGGSTGIVQELDWDGSLVWQFEHNSATCLMHHDIEPMPDGNVLFIAWEVKTAAEATAAGRTRAATMWPDTIVEIRPSGGTAEIVWEWHAWDHLVQDVDPARANYGVVADHPERIDVNLGGTGGGPGGGGDWLHINGVSYDPVLDQIAISSHFMDEIYVIDHGTTTAEAAGRTGGLRGRGGDILYRWGNPANYDAPGARVLDVVHSAWWVPAGLPGGGHLMIFNNNESARASVVIELAAPLRPDGTYDRAAGTAYGPDDYAWSYGGRADFYAAHLGGMQRLPNGNTLIAESTTGTLFEVSPDGIERWTFSVPRTEIPRALRYAPDYPGLIRL